MAYTLVPTELIVDGAITSAKLDTNIAISGTLGVTGEVTLATHLIMGDNDKIKIGTGGDLEIYHDGSNSYISNSTGNLYLGDTNGSVHIQAKLNEESIICAADGAVTLYYDNSSKLATTSTGIDVTGTATMDGLTVEGTATYLASLNNTAQDARIQLSRGGTEFGQVSAGGNLMNLVASGSNTDMRFLTNSAERMRIDSSGNVGIGASSPAYKLEVESSSDADLIQIQSTAGANNTVLRLGISGDVATLNASGGSTGSLAFKTYGTERMRIDTSGNLLIGKTGSNFGSAGIELRGSVADFIRDGNTAINVNRLSDNGELIKLHKDGTLFGSIGVIHDNNLFIGGVSHSGLQFGTSVIYPTATAGAANDGVVDLGASGNRFKNLYLSGSVTAPGGFLGGTNGGLRIHSGGTKFFNVTEANAARDGIMDIGAADARFKDLYLSGGVRLGGTGTANQLDDYEEGTWTPALYTYSGVTTSSITIYALYTKIGRICHIHAKITATLSSLPGQVVTITGLPFTAKDSGDTQQRAIMAIGGDTANTGGYTPKAHFRTSGSELKGIFWNASNNTAYWYYNSFDSPTFEIHIHGHYTTT
jgi:hypothetical protein